MKRKILTLAIIALIALAGCSKAPLPTDSAVENPEDTNGSFLKIKAIDEISTDITDADVYLNGNLIGKTPLDYETELQGTFAVRVQKEKFMLYGQSVTIDEGDVIYVEAVLKKMPSDKGQLLVTVDQDSCEIAVDDYAGSMLHQKQGKEMTALLPAAGYFVRVTKKGFEPISRATNVANDSVTIENLKMVALKETQPPQIELIVPDSAGASQPFPVEWRTENATQVDIDYITNPGLNGKREITFSTPGKRCISATAYNESGKVTQIDSIIIYESGTPQPAAPQLDFSASPKVVAFGDPVTVEWETNGSYVIIDNGIGTRGKQGSEEIVFKSSGTKVITAIAYNANRKSTVVKDSVYVKAPDGPVMPEIALAATDTVETGEPVTIEWQSQNAETVDIDYLGQVGPNGKTEVTFDTPGERTINARAYNQFGEASASATVFVKEKQPEIEPFTVESGAVVVAYHQSLPKVDENAAQVNIQTAGNYRIVAEVDYNSGDEQINESFFISVKVESGETQWPQDPNVGKYKVVPDEPGEAHFSMRDAGKFYLPAGLNTIRVHHYKTIAEEYPQFVNGEKISGANSVTTVSFKFEFIGF